MFRPRQLILAAIVVASACSVDSRGPAGPGGESSDFDAAAARAEIDRFDAAVSTGPMAALTSTLAAPGDPLQAFASSPPPTGVGTFTRLLAHSAIRADRFLTGGLLGVTLAFDPELGQYAPDPDRTGAPADGVRLILYEDDGSGRPDPSREIGWIDVIDRGASVDGFDARLIGVVDGGTFLDYAARVNIGVDGLAIDIAGFFSGAGDRYDFDFGLDIDGEVGEASVIDVALRIESPDRPFAIDGAFTAAIFGSASRIEHVFDVRYGDRSARVVSEFADDRVDAEVFVGGDLFATVNGDLDDPTILDANGEPLSAFEALVLLDLVDLGEEAFAAASALLSPLALILVLSLFGGLL